MTPYYEQSGITIYYGDCMELLPSLSCDVMIVDPPYDVRTHAGARTAARVAGSVDRPGKAGRKTPAAIEIDFAPLDVVATVPLLLAATTRWIIAFCAMEMIAGYQAAAGDAWVRAGFWRRPDGAPQFTGDRPGTPGDAIAIMHKSGKKRWNGGGHHAWWECGVERVDRLHPTQKPVALMRHLVEDFSESREVILDPFMGSGTTLVAAKALGRYAIGIEIEEKYCEIAAMRLQQEALPLDVV